MKGINNVNVASLEETIKAAQADPKKVWRPQKIAGEWELKEGGAQFRAEIAFEGGKVVMESDQPKSLGGWGTRPGPMHYCFFALLACYTTTFAVVASTMGIALKRLSAKLETSQNFSRMFGLAPAPVIEEVQIALSVQSDAPPEKLREIEKLATERCPAVYMLTQPVKLSTRMEIAT